ncbi:BTB/POZ domain-containing protein At1g03010 isoform X2 [Nymphaea colorata]|uniref:BTB/POZ domain-containing protein At1g03010 isoform X2 n=1 Tax=Nymphaea colorata TaxID=210225 RepID=UPI00129DFF20|nr:BTB/POZ domain-containing protein At1g03010 isoform X2 [Nymphaea colorata]
MSQEKPINRLSWPLSDVSSDLTVEVQAAKYCLHKFPLVSRSGKIRRMLAEVKDLRLPRISLDAFPGGAEAFELAAKFCYGINIEITLNNVATLRCAAHYLEMTEDFVEKNLEYRTENYLKEVVLPSISNSITVLHHCESLLPLAEDIKIVNRIINGIASNACKEQLTSGLSRLEQSFPTKTTIYEIDASPDSWVGDLTKLSVQLFKRVLSTLKSKGLKQDFISKILINYSQNTLQGGALDTELQNKQRHVIETIVELLPAQSTKSPVPIAFLSGLLKAATTAFVSTSCRSDLERRIGLQLDQAILEDILLPVSPSNSNSALLDTDSVQRIVSTFINRNGDDDDDDDNEDLLQAELGVGYEFENPRSPKQSLIYKVSKLLDSYLAEIATDSNLTPAKFIAIAELLPDHARIVSDGLYRAIDIFLKVHPNVKESERYRLCKAVDCQKLSQDACTHAAQNERLPVQMTVQVLYFEQTRLRNAMNGEFQHYQHHHHHPFFGSESQQNPHKLNSGAGSGAISPRDNYASVRRENRELKMEIARMRMRLTELEKDHVSIKQELIKSNPANKMINSFVKKLSGFNGLFRARDSRSASSRKAHVDVRFLFQKRRRHSVS